MLPLNRSHAHRPTRRPRWTALSAAAIGAALVLSGCGGPPDKKVDIAPTAVADTVIHVTGTFGTTPNVSYTIPWTSTEDSSEVIVAGTGPRIKDGHAALLAIYAQDGTDGEVIRDDFRGTAQTYTVNATTLGSDLYTALLGKRQGSRILHTVTDDHVPVIMTIDILPLRATGEPVKDVPTTSADGAPLPTVENQRGAAPRVVVPKKGKPPSELTIVPLLRGNGTQVHAGNKAVLQYVAVRWSTGETYDSTWATDRMPVTVTVGGEDLIQGLDDTLTEVPVGSRLLVVVPPDQAFALAGGKLGKETLVYVVDVLAAQGLIE